MEHFEHIIKTKIVTQEHDVFWEELEDNGTPFKEVQLLAITTPYTPESREDMQLKKILQACKLTEDAIRIIQIPADRRIAWHKLREAFHPGVVLLFGILPQQLGISAMLRLQAVNRFDDCLWVPAYDLSSLEKNAEAKKQLWLEALKPVFEDKTIVY